MMRLVRIAVLMALSTLLLAHTSGGCGSRDGHEHPPADGGTADGGH